MKSTKVFAFTLLFIGLAVINTAFIKGAGGVAVIKHNELGAKGFALVELFTSEGCSSCPPADELVAKVEKEVGDKPVYILAYHVDYWDRLGWKDIFSSAAYTKRQNNYAQWLNLSQIYTPQIIVNGKTEFVGSQEGALRNAIKAGLERESNLQLSIDITKNTNNTALVKYSIDGSIDKKQSVLFLALVQKHAISKVKSGENGGRTLVHVQIVQSLQSIPLKDSGNSVITLPSGFNTEDWEVIGFVQNTNNGVVFAASRGRF